MISAEAIAARLAELGAPPDRPITVVATTASTNDDARRAAGEGAPHGAAFVAEAQTRGRGRSGRSWHSPPGDNVYLSVILRPAVPAAELSPLALAIGVAVADVVDGALGAARARIKWPNDVFVDDRKIAGVLVEASTQSSAAGSAISSVMAGVGLNVHAARFPAGLNATSLALAGGRELSRGRLAAELIAGLEDASARFESGRLDDFAESLAARDLLRGRRVRVDDVEGVAAGIDAQGRLLVQAAGGTVAVSSGEVSW